MEEQVANSMKVYLGEELTAAVILIVAALAVVGFVVWWATSKYFSMKHRVDKLEELPCEKHSALLEGHSSQISETRALLSRMEGQLEILVANSIERGNQKIRSKSGGTYSAKHSPRRLNDNGISLFKDSGADKFLAEHKDHFLEKIAQLQPKTALDVEDLALAVLQTSTNEDIFIPLKNWVYNAPARRLRDENGNIINQEVDLNDVLFVISLPLRDMYLEANCNIQQND